MGRRQKRFSRNRPLSGSSLKLAALFEGGKGLLVLLAGCGLLKFIHTDLHTAALTLVRHFHLNPASHYPQIFVDAAGRIHDRQLLALAAAAAVYAVVRVIEAIGLWLGRQWAILFGLSTGLIYVPLEVYEVMHGVTWPKVVVLVVNGWIVIYLLALLVSRLSGRG